MSNHLAIAAVTYGLNKILEDAFSLDFETPKVTASILPPDSQELKDEPPQLNIFLYQVSPSPAWRSADLPTRRSDGTAARKTQLGLDLYYLLTAYGKKTDENEYPLNHSILGSTLRALHSRPLLTRNTIANMLNDPLTPISLKSSDLADQIELVRFTPVSLNLEELSKLWSVFFQTPYRVSVAYKASVVLIDGKEEPTSPLPVRERTVYALPFQRPLIESVSPQFVTMSNPLVIHGQNLKSQSVKVLFGALPPVTPANDKIKNNKIEVLLPVGLRAGVNTVRVVHEMDLATGAHRIFESNTAAFMLRPGLKTPPTTHNVTGAAVKKGEITLKFKQPLLEKKQRVVLLLNQLNPPAGTVPFAYQFNAPKDNGIAAADIETDEIIFDFKDVAASDYLVRARVDGAETELEYDNTTGKYIKPKVTI
jgi:hypothetical protein